MPWRLGLVRLDAGATVVAHLHGDVRAGADAACASRAKLDRAGQAVLVALPADATRRTWLTIRSCAR